MIRSWKLTLLGFGCFAIVPTFSIAGLRADETVSPAKKVYVGTIDVKPEQRDQLLAKLKELEFKGVLEASKTSPSTIIYRGTREEFRAAGQAAQEFHFPELTVKKEDKATPTKAKGSKGNSKQAERDRKDEEILEKIGISEEKKEKFRELKKLSDEKMKDFPKNVKRMTPELQRKSNEYNMWWNAELNKIFTADELKQYIAEWNATGNHPAPTRPTKKSKKGIKPASPFSGQTDEDVFEKMKLTDKEKEGVDKLLAERAKLMEEFKEIENGNEKMEAGAKLNKTWTEGLKKVLGPERYKEYSSYWERPSQIR